MSGPSGVMDRCSPPRLKLLIVFLLVSTNIVCLHGNPTTGVNHGLRCVNDYMYTINCSLSIAPSENGSDSNSFYWLTIKSDETDKVECRLTNTNGDYFCSAQVPKDVYYEDTFVDTVTFEILLCHNQNNGAESCVQLEDKYEPDMNITPNAPCCLTVSHNSSQHHFTWKSTYEEVLSGLDKTLEYQLQYYKRGDDPNMTPLLINDINYSVDDEQFAPGTEYAARVRTSPDQVNYRGHWSDWSSEVYWETESAVNDRNTFFSRLAKVLIFVCVSVPIVLFFCYAPVKKWRQSAFIPTPAPYFHTLYSDCQGDFKSWVVPQENTADMLKAEETLQIDTLTKCAVVEEEEVSQAQCRHHFMAGRTYSNITDPGCDNSLLGIPYAVCTMAPLSSPGCSLQSLTLSSQPGSPAEGDSGCWLERDPPWYCNEYCTLSGFQQCPVPAEHHGNQSTKPCSTGIISVEAITEA